MLTLTANAADVAALREVLAATPVGEVCGYPALDAAIGRDIRACRYLVLNALRQLNRDLGMAFGVVPRRGYQRLAADQAHMLGSSARARIRRSARRTGKMITRTLAAANEISTEGQRRALAEVATLNMLAHLSTDRVTKAQVTDGKPPTLAESLKGILQHIGAKVSTGLEQPA